MWDRIKQFLKRLTLAQQFLMANLIVLIIGMVIVGWWIGQQIKIGVIDYTAVTTALYMDSFVAPLVEGMAKTDTLSTEQMDELDKLLKDTPLGQEIVAFKIWNPEGRIVYASDALNIGRVFPIGNEQARAWQGAVVSEISNLSDEENVLERRHAKELLETYSPVRQHGTNRIIAVAEFYQPTEQLQQEVFGAQLRSWGLIGLSSVLMYLLLASIVKPASDVIIRQEKELRERLDHVTELLSQNETLSHRVRRAATRTTELNERSLRHISSELHDGPGQDLGFALLRIESLAENYHRHLKPNSENDAISDDFSRIHTALESALTEIRSISAGLRLPKIEALSPAETVRRALRDYERKTNRHVDATIESMPDNVPLPVRITLYRVVQEALSNGYRHAGGKDQTVTAGWDNEYLWVEIGDSGDGFNPKAVLSNGHFGLAGMRERVEILGGHFKVRSQPGLGATIRADLPRAIPEDDITY